MVVEIGAIRAALRPIARCGLRTPAIVPSRSTYASARIAPLLPQPRTLGHLSTVAPPTAGPSRSRLPTHQSFRFHRAFSSTRPPADVAAVDTTPEALRADASSRASSDGHVKPVTIPKSMPAWLFTCSGLVFGIIVIGGLTRLTESGLSITEWEPITGILPPIGDEQWAVEWDKYKVSPEGIMYVFYCSLSGYLGAFRC